jgi:hypothetical protein
MTKAEEKAVKNYVDLLLKVTFRICHWGKDGQLKSRSSGFLYQRTPESPIVVITAGHHTPPKGSFIETTQVYENQTLAVNTGEFKVFYNNNDIDYAYSILPLDLIKKSISKGMSFEFSIYKEPMIKAVNTELYGFAVQNNYEFVKYSDALVVPTYLCHELYMELVIQDDNINYFKTSRPIQDHEFYQGASGSPITDQYGRITSILIGGTDPIEFLKGFRLDNIDLP